MKSSLLPFIFAFGLQAIGLVNAASFDERLTEARKELQNGDKQSALRKFEPLKKELAEAVAKAPDDAHLQYLYGCVCMDGGFDEEAARALDKAISIAPKNANYLACRALLWEYGAKLERAKKLLVQATTAEPGDSRWWSQLSRVSQRTNDKKLALSSICKAIELSPKVPEFRFCLGELLAADNKTDEALRAFEQTLELEPLHPLASANIGQIHQNAGRNAEALKAFRTAVKCDPIDDHSWAKVVQLCQSLGNTKDRDEARTQLFSLWKAKKVDKEFYCREQFTHQGKRLMVFEYFDLKGDRAVRYSFRLIGEDGETKENISLGSYDATNSIVPKDSKNKQRIFHLDHYLEAKHYTLAMIEREPTYEETRAMVVSYLEGKLKPLSSSEKK